jgi:hypothetical protein
VQAHATQRRYGAVGELLLHLTPDCFVRGETKMFAALMLEQLVETDKVHLSDPVKSIIPR